LVADDGSNDGSLDFLLNAISGSDFKIRVISSDRRIGKAMLDNLLLKSIETEYYLNCDSDDWLLPNAIEKLLTTIEIEKFDLIIALNIDTNGIEQSTPKTHYNTKTGDAEFMLSQMGGDATILMRTRSVDGIHHAEVDFVVTESMAYANRLKGLTAQVAPFYAKVMDRSESNSISHSKGIKYCRGSAYALRNDLRNRHHVSHSNIRNRPRARELANLARYSLNGDLGLAFYFEALNDSLVPMPMRMLGGLIGAALSLRDRYFGGLVKTHIEFDTNKIRANIRKYP
jgi:glycosyltransferase involved in cell wall biosynthesis